MLKIIDVLAAAIAAVAAVAAAWAAITLNNLEQDRREFDEKMSAIRVLSEWSRSHTVAGVHCADLLSRYDRQTFIESAQTKEFHIIPTQQAVMENCFVGYDEQLDADGDSIFSSAERSYLAHQVTGELNAYEALSLYWSELGDKAKSMICDQARVDPTSPLREFRKDSKDTPWWNYPRFEDFLDQCR